MAVEEMVEDSGLEKRKDAKEQPRVAWEEILSRIQTGPSVKRRITPANRPRRRR